MGYQDPTRNNAPVKTDYFVVRNRDDVPDLADRFQDHYGDKPKELRIMLPSTLGQALDIRHVAFGGGPGTGGALKAIGQTNFALLGTLGGPDVITTWDDKSGEVVEVNITGVDDAEAKERQIELRMTFRFMLPQVLGVGGFATIDSKGKQSIDSLWQKLVELYGIFGPRITFAIQPTLKLRKATSRYYDERQSKWRTSSFFALDLVVPETFEDMFARLQERNELLSGEPRALPPAPQQFGDDSLPSAAAAETTPASDGDPAPVDGEPLEGEPEPEGEPQPVAEGEPRQEDLLGQSGQPSNEQWEKMKALFRELADYGGPPPELVEDGQTLAFTDTIDEGSGVVTSRWIHYIKAYLRITFGADSSEALTGAQMDQFIEHLDTIRIPF